ncbi:MAG: type II toxin-antitoxin system Phd/YefM family antitoxin [Gemmatimonadota bacterium]
MFKTEDICALSDFTRNARSHAERLRRTQRPEVLTLNGSAELVVQNAAAYQTLLDRLDELETLLALDEAAAEIDRGEVEPAAEMLAQLRQQLGIRKRIR